MKVSYSWSNQPSGMKSKVPSDEYYHYGDNVMVDTTYNNKSGYKEETWKSSSTVSITNKPNSSCYGNGKFVAIGIYSSSTGNYEHNTYVYSTDGITWTQGTLPSNQYWSSVCYGNDKFVAVVKKSNVFAYSTDGITWTEGTMPSNKAWYSVCYGNEKFVAVVWYSNIFAYSTNGITWTEGTMPSNKAWYSVCYGNDKFVAVASSSNVFAYSEDGITWTQGTLPVTDTWTNVYYCSDKFIAVVKSSKIFAYSTDGINWTQGTLPVIVQAAGAIYANNKYILVSYSGYYLYSTDGINWNYSYENLLSGAISLCYGNNKIVATRISTTFAYLSPTYYQFSGWNKSNFNITSNTAVSGSWSQVSSGGGVNFSELTPWKEETTTGLNAQIHDICCGNNIWLATGYQYVYYSTNDGLNWSKVQPGNTSDNWYYTCYGNGKFIITTTNGYMKYSIDAINWSNCTSNYSLTSSTASNWGTITYGNNMFVAAGNNTLGAYSLDGITWEKLSGSYHPSSYVTWCNDKFLAKASIDPGASYSLDGITWNKINGVESTNPPHLFAYGNGIYIGIYMTKSKSYPNYYSTDGINWNEYILGPESLQWYSIAVNEDSGKVIMVSLGTGSSDNAIIATCNGIPDLDYIR